MLILILLIILNYQKAKKKKVKDLSTFIISKTNNQLQTKVNPQKLKKDELLIYNHHIY